MPDLPAKVTPADLLAAQLQVPADELADDEHLAGIGLDSLGALRWRAAVEKATGVAIPLVEMTGDRTLAEVTATWRDRAGQGPTHPSGETTAEPALLTPVQEAYWAGRGEEYALGGIATFWYHEYDRLPTQYAGRSAVEDVAHLERAWRRVVARHPMLRTTIGRDAVPRVATYDVRDHQVTRVDLRDEPHWEERLAALREELSHQCRPTDRWPLCDVTAVLLPGGRVRWCVGTDALVVDFASWGRLMEDWGRVVAAPHVELSEPPTTFAEVLAGRAADLGRQRRRAADRAWWQQQDLPAGPDLPIAAPPERGARFVRHRRTVPAVTWGRVQEAAAEVGVSATTVVLTAFTLHLQRRARQRRDLTLNLTVYDRPDLPDVDEVVGDFSTTALLAVCQSDGLDAYSPDTFAELAGRLNRRFWDVLDHRTYSGVEVARDRDAAATWPVVFTSGLGQRAGENDRWLGERVFGVSQTPQVLLDHLVWEEDGDLVLVHDAVIGAYPEGLVEGLADAERALVESLADPARWHRPGVVWDPSGHPVAHVPHVHDAGQLLHDLWRRHLRQGDVDRPAVLTESSALSHDDLRRASEGLAGRLQEAGVEVGDLVLVALPKSPAQVVAVLALECLGAGYVPVDAAWPTRRLATAARKSAARLAVCSDADLSLPEGVGRLLVDEDGTSQGVETAFALDPGRDASPADLAYVIFTSGSTGEPKGVAIEHAQARTTIDDVNARYGIGPTDRVLAVSALSFDLSVHDVFGTLGAGGAMVLPDAGRARDPQHWLDLVARHRVTVWNSAPPLLEMLVEYAEADPQAARAALGHLRVCLLSGDWIPVTLPDRLRALAPQVQVHSLGGATEASIWSVTYPIGEVDPAWPSIPYGRPLRDQSFHVLDDHGGPVPVGTAGELYIGGRGLARCYLGDPDITAERFGVHEGLRERLYRTGDLGRWRPDGTLEFLGRVDRQVKIGGHRIELGEVEAAMLRTPGVRQALVSSMPGPGGRARLVAHVSRHRDDTEGDDDAFVARTLAGLGEEVPDYMRPSRVVVLPTLPMSANGKVDPTQLDNPFERPRTPSRPAAVPPSGPAVEELVVEQPVAEERVAAEAAPVAARTDTSPDQGGPVRQLLTALVGEEALALSPVRAGLTSLQLVRLANVIEDAGHARPGLDELIDAPALEDVVRRWDGPVVTTPRPVPAPAPTPTEPPAEPVSHPGASGSARDLAGRLRDLADLLDRTHVEAASLGLSLDVSTPGGVRGPASIPVAVPEPDAPAGTTAVPLAGSDVEAPLSEMQLAYLVGRAPDQDGRAVAPHYYTEALLQDLDVDRFAAAWRTVVSRHPMLRAHLTERSTQQVLPAGSDRLRDSLTVLDHRSLAPGEQQRERERIRAERSHRLLPVDQGPMVDLTAVRLSDRDWRLHLDLDLLFFDARSASVWMAELAQAYVDPRGLPAAPSVSFLDWADSPAVSPEAQSYADEQAATLPPGPPVARRGDPCPGASVVRRRRSYTPDEWSVLRSVARDRGVTPFVLLLDEIGRSLGGDPRSSSTLVVTVNDRPADHDSTVGEYTSTVLVPVDPSEGLEALQRRVMRALAHGTSPGSVHGNEVIRRLRRRHGSVDLPVAVSASLEPHPVDPSQLLDALGRTEYAISQTPQVLVDVQLFAVGQGLELVVDADESRVEPTWAEQLFADLLARIVGRLGRPRSAGTAGPAGARRHLAEAFSVLGPVDHTDTRSWFDLGATSLTLVTAHRRLRELGYEVEVVDLFAHPSPAALLALLVGSPGSPTAEKAPRRPERDHPRPPASHQLATRGARRRAARQRPSDAR